MITLCAPIIRPVTRSVRHHATHAARHLTHTVARRLHKAIHHAVTALVRPTLGTSLVCKAIPAVMIGGALLVGLPTTTPPLFDGTASTIQLDPPLNRRPAGTLDPSGREATSSATFASAPIFLATDPGSPTQPAPGAGVVPGPLRILRAAAGDERPGFRAGPHLFGSASGPRSRRSHGLTSRRSGTIWGRIVANGAGGRTSIRVHTTGGGSFPGVATVHFAQPESDPG